MRHGAVIIGLLGLISLQAFAGGWSNAAVPSRIDIERGNGVMVYGDFGNAGACSLAGRFYLKKEHPQYAQAYAAILAAFGSGKKVQVYIHGCEPVTWYATTATTFNIVGAAGAINIMN